MHDFGHFPLDSVDFAISDKVSNFGVQGLRAIVHLIQGFLLVYFLLNLRVVRLSRVLLCIDKGFPFNLHLMKFHLVHVHHRGGLHCSIHIIHGVYIVELLLFKRPFCFSVAGFRDVHVACLCRSLGFFPGDFSFAPMSEVYVALSNQCLNVRLSGICNFRGLFSFERWRGVL